MLPTTVFLMDQLVALLCDSYPSPMATVEILERLPAWCNYRCVYRVLRNLESQSMVYRAYLPETRTVFWTSDALLSTTTKNDITALENLYFDDRVSEGE